jgi:hypothetical protein
MEEVVAAAIESNRQVVQEAATANSLLSEEGEEIAMRETIEMSVIVTDNLAEEAMMIEMGLETAITAVIEDITTGQTQATLRDQAALTIDAAVERTRGALTTVQATRSRASPKLRKIDQDLEAIIDDV